MYSKLPSHKIKKDPLVIPFDSQIGERPLLNTIICIYLVCLQHLDNLWYRYLLAVFFPVFNTIFEDPGEDCYKYMFRFSFKCFITNSFKISSIFEYI